MRITLRMDAREKLGTLRDEVKLHLHLASLDAKKEWSEKLEPRINEIQSGAQQLSQDVLERVEAFVAKLRASTPAAHKA